MQEVLKRCLAASLRGSGELELQLPVHRQRLGRGYMLEFAIEVAARAHCGQLRKGSLLPYISHPLAVGLLLFEAGADEEVIAAGILHDTVEDTALTHEYLVETFGPRVAAIVEGCTEPRCGLGWEECKRRSIAHVEVADADVQLVVCADKLHNAQSLIAQHAEMGEALWTHFARGRAAQTWYYRSMTLALGRRLQGTTLHRRLCAAVTELFGPA